MREIRIDKTEYQELRNLQTNKRGDCHAAFSTNLSENPWAFQVYGLTPEELRKELKRRAPKLLEVVGLFVEDRRRVENGPGGGRFFLDLTGAYWKDKDRKRHRFVEWKFEESISEEVRRLPEQTTWQKITTPYKP